MSPPTEMLEKVTREEIYQQLIDTSCAVQEMDTDNSALVLAQEIVEQLEAALEKLKSVEVALAGNGEIAT